MAVNQNSPATRIQPRQDQARGQSRINHRSAKACSRRNEEQRADERSGRFEHNVAKRLDIIMSARLEDQLSSLRARGYC